MAKYIDMKIARLTGVITFPSILNKTSFDNASGEFIDDNDGKYGFTLLVAKNSPSANRLINGLDDLNTKAVKQIDGFKPAVVSGTRKMPCSILDGDDEEYADNETVHGHYIVNFKFKKWCKVLDRNRFKVKEGDEETIHSDFYAGSVITVSGSIYTTDSVSGVFANIPKTGGFIFSKDGKPLGEAEINDDDMTADEDDLKYYDDFNEDDFEDD